MSEDVIKKYQALSLTVVQRIYKLVHSDLTEEQIKEDLKGLMSSIFSDIVYLQNEYKKLEKKGELQVL